MNTFLLILLGLTALAIPAARIMAVVQGAPKWDYTQRCNLYNLGWVVGIFAFYLLVCIVVSVPLWFGFITLLPVLAICAFSLIAAYDWDTTPSTFGARMNAVAYGDGSRAAAKIRLKIRRYVGIGVLGFLAIGWLAFTITGGDSQSNSDTAAPNKDRGTTTAPASPTAPATPSSAAPSKAAPSTNASTDPCVNSSVELSKSNKSANVSGDIDVCVNGKWVSKTFPANTQVTIVEWKPDGSGGEYDVIEIGGKRMLTHTYKV